jgi:hypothetical protein
MTKHRTHKHHIIPKHMGGTDDPSNLMELTVAEHAEAHKKLWEEHNQEWDRIAWLALSGQVNMTEAKRLVQLEAIKRGGAIARANMKANGTSIGDWVKRTGYVRNFTKEDCFKGGSASGKLQASMPKWIKIQSLGGKVGGKIASAITNAQRWICLECGKVDRPASLGWHMKKQNHVLKVQL